MQGRRRAGAVAPPVAIAPDAKVDWILVKIHFLCCGRDQ
jgi:hypothetical protein